MTIQENNRLMKEQLLSQARKCRARYAELSVKRGNDLRQQMLTELITRAEIFEKVAHNLLRV